MYVTTKDYRIDFLISILQAEYERSPSKIVTTMSIHTFPQFAFGRRSSHDLEQNLPISSIVGKTERILCTKQSRLTSNVATSVALKSWNSLRGPGKSLGFLGSTLQTDRWMGMKEG